jgi:hypothetical protein
LLLEEKEMMKSFSLMGARKRLPAGEYLRQNTKDGRWDRVVVDKGGKRYAKYWQPCFFSHTFDGTWIGPIEFGGKR